MNADATHVFIDVEAASGDNSYILTDRGEPNPLSTLLGTEIWPNPCPASGSAGSGYWQGEFCVFLVVIACLVAFMQIQELRFGKKHKTNNE